jgi:hypothetical protein
MRPVEKRAIAEIVFILFFLPGSVNCSPAIQGYNRL